MCQATHRIVSSSPQEFSPESPIRRWHATLDSLNSATLETAVAAGISLQQPSFPSHHRGQFQQASNTNKRILVLGRAIVRQNRMPHTTRRLVAAPGVRPFPRCNSMFSHSHRCLHIACSSTAHTTHDQSFGIDQSKPGLIDSNQFR